MLSIQTRITGSEATLALAGRFDFHARKHMKEAYAPVLADPAIRTVRLDLSAVDYVDSSALGILLLLKDRVDEVKKHVVLYRPAGTVAQVLEVANFAKLFEIIKD